MCALYQKRHLPVRLLAINGERKLAACSLLEGQWARFGHCQVIMDSLDYWRLCDELSVVQAALLIVGEDPAQTQKYIDGWAPENRPPGYDAAKAALVNAISGNLLKANIVELESAQVPDWHHTTIAVEDLKGWLT